MDFTSLLGGFGGGGGGGQYQASTTATSGGPFSGNSGAFNVGHGSASAGGPESSTLLYVVGAGFALLTLVLAMKR